MGCGSSKANVDFGELDQARKQKDAAVFIDDSVGGYVGNNNKPTAGHHAQQAPPPHTSSNSNSLLPQPKQILQAATPALENLATGPSFVTQVKATTAIVLGKTHSTAARGAHHLKNVFATPISDNEYDNFVAPVFGKNQEEKQFIRTALKQNFVFASLSEREIRTIIDAFEQITVNKVGEIVIKQGDVGDYFYVLRSGKIRFEVNNQVVGYADPGQSFGELAMLYTSPRAASAIAQFAPSSLYRVDQKTFRYIMQSQTLQTEADKKSLLESVTFLKDLDPTDINKLVHVMTPRKFEAGEYLVRKGDHSADDVQTFFVIQEGKVKVTDITIGSTDYEDQVLGAGDYFGERALMTKEPRTANCVATTKGIALTIDNETFVKVVGNLSALTTKAEDRRKLAAIKVFQMTKLSMSTLGSIAEQMLEQTVPPHTTIFAQDDPKTPAALYFVRSGNVRVYSNDGRVDNIIDSGGYFGEDMMEVDIGKVKISGDAQSITAPKYNAMTLNGEVTLAVLTIDDLRDVIDTTQLGHPKKRQPASVIDSDISLASLKKHAILGAGTFGQVWLVSHQSGASEARRPYALKIQSKYELVSNHQARGVVNEKNLMQRLHHPFLIRLVQTYQDKQYVYMLLGLVQGGELFSLLHQASYDGISEKDAKFYGAGILEGLSHMHRRHILYRDLKPENVLIDAEGYPVIVDFGFGKWFRWGSKSSDRRAKTTIFVPIIGPVSLTICFSLTCHSMRASHFNHRVLK